MNLTVTIWFVIFIASDLPEAIWQLLTGTTISWLFWFKIILLLAMLGLRKANLQLHKLTTFLILVLLFIIGRKVMNDLGLTTSYVANSPKDELILRLAIFESARLLISIAMLAVLFIDGKRRNDLFLRMGDLKKWKVPGLIIAIAIMLATFLFFDFDFPSRDTLLQILPLIPFLTIFAALGAFDEELRYRATFLPAINSVVGKNQAVLITAFFFGMNHYYGGVPSGFEGFFVAGGLGLLYAVMMLETKGIVLPWFNHFLTNIPTFLLWAVLASSR